MNNTSQVIKMVGTNFARKQQKFLRRAEQAKKAFFKSSNPYKQTNSATTVSQFRTSSASTRPIVFGKSTLKGLAIKQSMRETRVAEEIQNEVIEKINKSKEKPKHFVLERVMNDGTFIQEVKHKPSAYTIEYFLRSGGLKIFRKEDFSRLDYSLCKKLFAEKQNIALTYLKICDATSELDHWINSSIRLDPSNYLVLGMTKDGKVRLAIIDI